MCAFVQLFHMCCLVFVCGLEHKLVSTQSSVHVYFLIMFYTFMTILRLLSLHRTGLQGFFSHSAPRALVRPDTRGIAVHLKGVGWHFKLRKPGIIMLKQVKAFLKLLAQSLKHTTL